MLTKEQVIQLLRENYPHLVTEYGVKRIGLFGSYAKGTPNEQSDVDVVVEFERPIGFKFIELTEYLETLFDRKVDVLTPAGLQAIRFGQVAQNIAESILYV
ncbi:MAG TPA: nucleotidyltransferase family protein [Blastocatellia bacterium]|nr:nucleotidyltransferase family protein [Blastocatellia bacterium]